MVRYQKDASSFCFNFHYPTMKTKRKTKSKGGRKTKPTSTLNLKRKDVFPDNSKELFTLYQKNEVSDKAYQRYMDKPYQETYKLKRKLASIAGIFLQIFGGFLASFAIYRLLSYIIPTFPFSEALAITLAILLLVLLEFAKRVLWSELFSERYRNGKYALASVMISVVLFAISSTSSTIGCYQLTIAMMDSTQQIQEDAQQTNLNLESNYNTQIQSYRQQLAQAEQEIQKKIKDGTYFVTPYSERKRLDFYRSQIEQLQAERNLKTDKVEDTASTESISVQQKAQNYALAGFGVSALFEVLALCCIAYLAFYDFRVYLEVVEKQKAAEPVEVEAVPFEMPSFNMNQMMQLLQKPQQLQQIAAFSTAWEDAKETINTQPYGKPSSIGFQLETQQQMQTRTQEAIKLYDITCVNCGKKTQKRSPRAKYCSDHCGTEYRRKNG